jgi:16S rRNA (cytosine1402-N4)-methyltransferase
MSLEERFHHQPVLLAEVLRLLVPQPGKLIVDGTLGGGGHAEALLRAGAQVIGIDQDADALAHATKRLSGFGEAFRFVRANFSQVQAVLDELGVSALDGALLDIGVSSWQLDAAERGFSFQKDGPLDMRMDQRAGVTAADLVNEADESELLRIFRTYGEEPAARRVAAQIVRERARLKYETTFDLVRVIEMVLPRRGKTHPATRVFQALRIAVNRELDVLESALESFTPLLAPGGRLAVITFHSLEDRIVKHFFKARSVAFLDRPEWPEPRPNPDYFFKLITPHPVIAGEEEQQQNPRARSAKLRVVERISSNGFQS